MKRQFYCLFRKKIRHLMEVDRLTVQIDWIDTEIVSVLETVAHFCS